MNTVIIKHGSAWILNGSKLTCPECGCIDVKFKIDIVIDNEKLRQFPSHTTGHLEFQKARETCKIYTMDCKCDLCFCEFSISKTNKDITNNQEWKVI